MAYIGIQWSLFFFYARDVIVICSDTFIEMQSSVSVALAQRYFNSTEEGLICKQWLSCSAHSDNPEHSTGNSGLWKSLSPRFCDYKDPKPYGVEVSVGLVFGSHCNGITVVTNCADCPHMPYTMPYTTCPPNRRYYCTKKRLYCSDCRS